MEEDELRKLIDKRHQEVHTYEKRYKDLFKKLHNEHVLWRDKLLIENGLEDEIEKPPEFAPVTISYYQQKQEDLKKNKKKHHMKRPRKSHF